MDIKIGADPELFVQLDGKFISAHGLIPGTKEKPYPVERGAVQVDGMALEFNIDPAIKYEDFQYNVTTVLCELRKMVPSEYEFVLSSTAEFDPEYMKTLPKEAVELGCDPDFNAWTGQVNERPDQHSSMRTAAGHLHIGWTEGADPYDDDHFVLCTEIVREMDAYLGLHSLLVDRDQKRRQMYGQAGAFRPKPYGLEYRVLSNYWVANPQEMLIMWHNSRKAVGNVVNDQSIIPAIIKSGVDLQGVINTGDQRKAMEIIGEYHAN
jgi:hypothetical protein